MSVAPTKGAPSPFETSSMIAMETAKYVIEMEKEAARLAEVRQLSTTLLTIDTRSLGN
jgi:hypothetical protein